jgi:addiction module RelB/DinJ family antitoxin
MKAVQIATRVDESVKNSAARVLKHYGLDVPTALKMFITQIASEHRVPLDISRPVISLDGDSFDSDQEYFEQIPGFLNSIDAEVKSTKRYAREEVGL